MEAFKETKKYAREWMEYYRNEANYYREKADKFRLADLIEDARQHEGYALDYETKAGHFEIMLLAVEAYELNIQSA